MAKIRFGYHHYLFWAKREEGYVNDILSTWNETIHERIKNRKERWMEKRKAYNDEIIELFRKENSDEMDWISKQLLPFDPYFLTKECPLEDIIHSEEAALFHFVANYARECAENYAYIGDKENAKKWFKKAVEYFLNGLEINRRLIKENKSFLVVTEWTSINNTDDLMTSAILSEDEILITNIAKEIEEQIHIHETFPSIKYLYEVRYYGYILSQIILDKKINLSKTIEKRINKSKKRYNWKGSKLADVLECIYNKDLDRIRVPLNRHLSFWKRSCAQYSMIPISWEVTALNIIVKKLGINLLSYVDDVNLNVISEVYGGKGIADKKEEMRIVAELESNPTLEIEPLQKTTDKKYIWFTQLVFQKNDNNWDVKSVVSFYDYEPTIEPHRYDQYNFKFKEKENGVYVAQIKIKKDGYYGFGSIPYGLTYRDLKKGGYAIEKNLEYYNFTNFLVFAHFKNKKLVWSKRVDIVLSERSDSRAVVMKKWKDVLNSQEK